MDIDASTLFWFLEHRLDSLEQRPRMWAISLDSLEGQYHQVLDIENTLLGKQEIISVQHVFYAVKHKHGFSGPLSLSSHVQTMEELVLLLQEVRAIVTNKES